MMVPELLVQLTCALPVADDLRVSCAHEGQAFAEPSVEHDVRRVNDRVQNAGAIKEPESQEIEQQMQAGMQRLEKRNDQRRAVHNRRAITRNVPVG